MRVGWPLSYIMNIGIINLRSALQCPAVPITPTYLLGTFQNQGVYLVKM